MANTISADAIAKVLIREYQRDLTPAYKVLPYANRKYEWEIKAKWDTVRIPTIAIGEWQANNNPLWPANDADLTIDAVTLQINQYYDIRVKLSDKDISDLGKDLSTTQRVARLMKDKAQKIQEDYLVTKLLGVTNKVANPVALTWANIFAEITRIEVEMDKKNVPSENRQLFVSPEIAWILQNSNILVWFREWFKAQSTWAIWMVAWFEVVKTNTLTWANAKKLIWYQGNAWTFINKLETIKIKEAVDWNYWNLVGGLYFDAGVLGNDNDRVCLYEWA